MADVEQYDVVICGAGPAGLTLSILLSRMGIRHLVVDRRAGISGTPRARGINHRTGEIWGLFGLGEALRAMTLPPVWLSQMVYQETLAGELIGVVKTPGSVPGGSAHLTPSDHYCISQDRTDAMLARHAGCFAEATIRFGVTFIGAKQHAADVDIELDTDTGRQWVRAGWLVGCDGSDSTVRRAAGIEHRQIATLDSFINVHFDADLSRWTAGRESVLMWNMQEGAEGMIGPLDGERYWRCQINFDPESDPIECWDRDRILARIRGMIGAPEAEAPEIELRSYYSFTVRAAIAAAFVQERILLAGDAAHQTPPHGALGMNSAVQSAHNLAWKLAAVIRGEADARLLESYESERREVAERVINHAVANYTRMLDIRQRATAEQRRDNVRGAHSYGNALGLDLGVHYSGAGAFVADNSTAPDTGTEYIPSARPGWRAPHFWFRRNDERLSSIALSDGQFVLLAGPDGQPWVDAARALGVVGATVGAGGTLVPEGVDFEQLYGIAPGGAVLIRPDGHVAFRSRDGVGDAPAMLDDVFRQIGVQPPRSGLGKSRHNAKEMLWS
ncbi:MAG: hypothetical protein JWR80_8303 [Bradyrhizobium sp.]|nr:hypothetical protein [Bradyrhizobium sp.]